MFDFHKIINFFVEKKEPFMKTKNQDDLTETSMVSPKGIWCKPKKDEVSVVFKFFKKTLGMPLQKYIELGDGDVIVTDNKSEMLFKYEDGKIEIKGDTIFKDGVTIKGSLEVEGDIKVKGEVTVDKTIKATGDIQSEKDIKATGNMEATGRVKGTNVEGTADVKAGQVSVVGHTHMYTDTNGTATATAPTSAPVPTG